MMRALNIRDDQIPIKREVRLFVSSILLRIREIPRMLSADRKISTIKRMSIMNRSVGAKV